MSTDTPDPRVRAALTLVDSPYLDRDDTGVPEEDRDALDLIARIMGEFHALAPSAPGRGEPAFRWGPLDVYEEIGRGTFGVVHLARDPRLDLDVALKLQHLDAEGDAHAMVAEARRLARVRHINVCAVLGVDVHDGQVGLWTEHVGGRTLAARLEDGAFSVPETIRIGVQLLRALHAVHAADLVHGDVTAGNVIETPDGRIVLADFGSSVMKTGANIPRTGTPVAMAPELFTDGALSPVSDVYALGALLFRLLTGHHLVVGESVEDIARAHRTGERRAVDGYRDDVPAPLAEVISVATAPEPADRYRSASGMLDALSRSGVPPHNLPLPATSFVGRGAEKADVRRALETGRLVTVTGIGGVGKTRLATELARDVLHAYPDGVWLVELDDVAGPDDVLGAIAAVCGLSPAHASTTEDLVAALGGRRLLLVLDNCEHVREAVVEFVGKLLARAIGPRAMCTSRSALGVPGEVIVSLAPLPIGGGPSAAGQLFIERLPLRLRREDDVAWMGTVARICDHVDGIPLAIELAAARAGVLDLTDLERRLATQLGVLATHGGSRPERHRTMAALVGWSVDLLDETCSTALTVLGVFPGSFTLDAAEHILAASLPALADPLGVMVRLVDGSLVDRIGPSDGESTTRYRLLVPVREFAANALLHHDRDAQVRDVFHTFYCNRVIEMSKASGRGRPFLDAAHVDIHNIHVALQACIENPALRERTCALVIALFDYWYDRGSRREGERAVERALAGGDETVTPNRARLRYLSGVMAWERGEEAIAQNEFERALREYRSLGLGLEAAKALSALGNVAGAQGRRDEAVALLEESVGGYREVGDVALEGEAYNNIGGLFLTAGIHETARGYFERATPLLRRSESHRVLALTLMNLARLDELTQRESDAVSLLEEANGAALRATDMHTASFADARRGEILAKAGHPDRAIPVLEGAIRVARRVHDDRTIAFAGAHLARCHTQLGDRAAAVRQMQSCLRVTCDLRSPDRPDMIRLAVREAGYVAALCERWAGAAWMLGWSADYAARHERTIGPHERERFARANARLVATEGPDWRETVRGSELADEESAITRAMDELAACARRA